MKIGIDPGHGAPDEANRGPTGYVEAHGVLDIATACRDELLRHGHEVYMTRTGREGLSLAGRARKLNDAKVDIAVSIHTNAAPSPQARGVETIHSILGGRGKELAKIIADQLTKDLGLPLRRVFSRRSETTGKDYYTIIQKTAMPCVIVEVAFHSNPVEEKLLKDPAFRKKAGISIARGIMRFAGGEQT